MIKKERRRATRKDLSRALIAVYTKKPPTEIEYKARLCNISSLGLKFISFKPYDNNTIIHFSLLLPNQNTLLDTSGRVVRCEKQDDEKYFIALDLKEGYFEKSLIEDYIEVMELWEKS